MNARDRKFYDNAEELTVRLSKMVFETDAVARLELIQEALSISRELFHSYSALATENIILQIKLEGV